MIHVYIEIYMYLCSTLYDELLRLVSSIKKTLSRKTGVRMVALLKNLQPMQLGHGAEQGPCCWSLDGDFPGVSIHSFGFTHLLGRVG